MDQQVKDKTHELWGFRVTDLARLQNMVPLQKTPYLNRILTGLHSVTNEFSQQLSVEMLEFPCTLAETMKLIEIECTSFELFVLATALFSSTTSSGDVQGCGKIVQNSLGTYVNEILGRTIHNGFAIKGWQSFTKIFVGIQGAISTTSDDIGHELARTSPRT